MIIEATGYFAKQGKLEAVIAQRKRACDLRVKLGLPAGRVVVRISGDGPDVRWEQSYETEADYKDDRLVREGSAEFKAAVTEMNALIDRFERHVYSVLNSESRDHRQS